mgnify:CR=1 FL=1
MKFQFYKQHDSMECGVTCLQMIGKHYGKEYSLEKLHQYCFATKEGVSLLGISEAAGQLGFHTTCGRLTIDQLNEIPLPCILHWNQNHFVVLYQIRHKQQFYIADPGKGLVTYKIDEFSNHWVSQQSNGEAKGIALLLQPTTSFYAQTEEQVTHKRSFRFLSGYVKEYQRFFGQILLGAFVGCLLQLILPFLTQAIVDIGIKQKNLNFIYLVLIGQLVLAVSRTCIDFIRRWLLLHISMRINISLVSDFFIKLLKLPMSFFDTKLMGDLLQRMNDHNRVERFLTTHLLNIAFSLLSFLVFGYVLFFYNRMIFGIFLLGSILYALWISFFLKRRKILDYELFEKQAENNNKTYQFITTMQEIKLQDCEQRRRWEWEDIQADLFAVQMKSLKLQQTQEAGSIFINEVKNIVITVIAATAVINGQMTLGMMLAVQYIIGQLNSPVEQLMNFIYSLQDVKISLERINEVHMAKEEERENLLTHYQSEIKTISLKDVAFKYDPHAPKNTLEHISFQIPAGKVTAIVGASGSGKTTLIKLMLGYYPVTAGSISIADENINNYNLKWWRKQCGVVMQDGVIFSESIARNIAVDDGEVDIQKLEEAAKIANIHDYIMKLPLKYNTLIGRDGVGLSQGQKQRILIARAVYRNPSFIFLDEATNALDAKNEKVIIENLNKFYQGRTVIVVAHRLSTVKNADQIIVLDNGKIAEIGNHVSLIEKQGLYYNLVRNQLELGN